MDGGFFLQKWARFPSLPRIFHVPESVRNTKPFTPPGTDLSFWQWEDDGGRPTAIVFQGGSDKPLWKYTFGTDAQRRHEIDETIRLRKEQLSEERAMTLRDRVLARYKQALDVGRSFFTEHLKFHHWRGHLAITDMANAGKRGKKVRELSVFPATQDDAFAEKIIKQAVKSLTTDSMTYDSAKAKLEKIRDDHKTESGAVIFSLSERVMRGVDVEPAGTKIELHKKFPEGSILEISASPHDFMVNDKAWITRGPGQPGFFQDTLYSPVSKQDGIVFYAWIKENVSKAGNMTIRELEKVWDQLGVRYNSH